MSISERVRYYAREVGHHSVKASEDLFAIADEVAELEKLSARTYPTGGDIVQRLHELMGRDLPDSLASEVQSALTDMAALVSDAVQYAGRAEKREVPEGAWALILPREQIRAGGARYFREACDGFRKNAAKAAKQVKETPA